jgi:hypothetical protein
MQIVLRIAGEKAMAQQSYNYDPLRAIRAAKLAMGQKIQAVAEGDHLYVRFRYQLSDEVMAALVSKFAHMPRGAASRLNAFLFAP